MAERISRVTKRFGRATIRYPAFEDSASHPAFVGGVKQRLSFEPTVM
ncbi:MAG: hypothetical protein GWP08_07490 [Nitrospiraceae bacterium]|nr:hypothetical protein [Nitrospiraceae bacterium]